MQKRAAKGRKSKKPGSVTDLTLTSVDETELRRRASEGDQRAVAELARRGLSNGLGQAA